MMKQTFRNIAIASVAGCLTLTSAWVAQAQNQNSNNDNWNNRRAVRLFTAQNMKTIEGKVLSVEQSTTGRQGVHLQVQTDSGNTMTVALGPRWFVNSQQPQIKPNDQVEITGAQSQIEGQSGLIASTVRAHGELLQLRDENGRPVWRRSQGMMGQNQSQGMMGGSEGMMGHGQGMMSRSGKNMMSQGSANGCEDCQQMKTQQSGRHMMSQGQMMQHRQAMLAKLQQAQAKLDKKVEKMNQATGQAKINAMASVINELAQQREELINHLERGSQQMMSHMRQHQQQMQGMMGGSENGTGGSNWSSTWSGDEDQE
jgi:hypothetical protein